MLPSRQRVKSRTITDFFSNFGKDPRASQIGKISVVSPKIGKFVKVQNFVSFGQ